MTQTNSDTVTINVDGQAVEARPGEMIIAAAERAGTYIPRFCYHPRMRSVGMCRMCLVEVKGPRGFSLVPACFQAVSEGQEIRTESEAVRKAQNGVLEFLLLNHPLDCPVCDKGGECPLQDQTLAYGPAESRFVEEKRHWAKPIPVSSLVDLDRERCIQCDRCTRFASEIAGEPLITFQGRGDHIEVNTFPDLPFSSYFSGNTIQICPVGALTSSVYRFKARPWDLEQVESTCTSCAVGCRTVLQSTTGRLVRHLGVDVDSVNQSWLCDKGRWGYQSANSPDRRLQPFISSGGQLVEASWSKALSLVAGKISEALAGPGAASIAVLGGAHLPNEDAYAWAKLAKGLIGTDAVDAQMGDGLPAELIRGLPRATIDEACQAKAVVVLGSDLREELPVLFLRLRTALLAGSTAAVELATHDTSLTRHATASLRHLPGGLAALVDSLVGSDGDNSESSARSLLGIGQDAPGSGVVVILGRPSIAEPASAVVDATAALLAALPGAKFLPVLRRGNLQGALDAGLAPGLLPGRVAFSAGAEHYRSGGWENLAATPGRGADDILAAAAGGEVEVLILLGSDPLSNFPDRQLARSAIEGARFVVSVETLPNATSEHADVVFPAAAAGERSGTTTNIEGRISPQSQLVASPGQARPDWIIATELAEVLGMDLGVSCLEDIREEMSNLSPLHAGLLGTALGGEGVVLPVSVSTLVPAPTLPLDPMATPGIMGAQTQGSPSFSGSANRVQEVEEGSEGATPGRPAMISWKPTGTVGQSPAPSVPKGSLTLVVARRLYDRGTEVAAAPSLAPLARSANVSINPETMNELGLHDGDETALSASRSRIVVPVKSDPGVPAGVALIGVNLPGGDALELLEVGDKVTFVQLEKL